MKPATASRILIIDDNPAIHEDFLKILSPSERSSSDLADMEDALFGPDLTATRRESVRYDLEASEDGRSGVERAGTALKNGTPFALAFVDMRMPGWDGMETVENLWKVDPNIQIVICTAYSDYSWEDMQDRLGITDSLLILKKPFDHIEVRQLAAGLCRKWELNRKAEADRKELTEAFNKRTAQLRHSEERFATAFRSAPLPQAIIDPKYMRVVDANEAFLQLTACTSVLLDQFRDELLLKTGLSGTLTGAHPMERVQTTLNSLAGETRHVQLFTQPTLLDHKPLLLLTARDITERRRLEEQLQHAQKMEAVGQLAAGVAHDFNNILTVIQGHLSLHLMSDDFNSETRDSMEEMLTASERAATLTRQLLTFSRKHLFQPGPQKLDVLVQQQMSLLRRLLGESIDVTVRSEEKLPCIQGDGASIEQVVLNLVINARDAMPEGGTLSITTESVENPTHDGKEMKGSFVRLAIRDSGTGMSEGVKSRIFEPFFTTKDVGHGTGMGLATVYGIIQQHEGWIEVESTEGAGTTFQVYLPTTIENPEGAEDRKKSDARKVHLKALLVEDEPAVRAVMRQLLRHCGCQVTEAEDARQGIKAWNDANGDFELLVTDIVMPGGMSGHDLAKQLLQKDPALKIIYCSGYSAEHFNDASELIPGKNFLPKPYTATSVIDLVTRMSLKEEPAILSS